MLPTRGYAATNNSSPLAPFNFSRREPKAHDVLVKILFCGICHSDIHSARNEWKGANYPLVPGHEIVGRVERVGDAVQNFKIGDIVGIGCFVDSCRKCKNCKNNEEQFCETGVSFTYNSTEQDKKTPTYGGYSSQIVVDENYLLRVSEQFPLANLAPLLCAGITTYAPLKRYKVGPGTKVGILGLGGLGHMGVKIAVAMGAEVTVLSTSPAKEKDALNLGAHKFIVTKDPKSLENSVSYFDFILDTVGAKHDLTLYLNLLHRCGVMVLVGIAEQPLEFHASALVMGEKILAGSLIGGIKQTQEMLDFCAKNNITADVEIIPIQKINEAYERTIKGDVHYRFVIDMNTL